MASIPKLLVLSGLPGSGKTTLLESGRFPRVTGVRVHDFHANAIRNSAAPQSSRHFRAVVEGEAAAALDGTLGAKAEPAPEFAYRLCALRERKKHAAEALAYNGSRPELARTDPPRQRAARGQACAGAGGVVMKA